MNRAQFAMEPQAAPNPDLASLGQAQLTVTARDGASARLERTADAESLTVRDREGRLLFQYDSASGRGVLVMPEGDLCLAAPRGRIELVAAGGIRAISGGEIAIEGKGGVRLGVVDGASSIRVDREGAAIEADRATIRARARPISTSARPASARRSSTQRSTAPRSPSALSCARRAASSSRPRACTSASRTSARSRPAACARS